MYIVVGLYISIFDVYIEQFYVCENFKLICILVCIQSSDVGYCNGHVL